MIKKISLTLTIACLTIICFAQENSGEFHGDFDLNMQSYQEDKLIEAEPVDEIILNNAYLNINYTQGNFAAGLRYESYLNALLDFDDDYKGNGIPFRYATYTIDGLEVTAGNYYEQIGSGLIFRSYENKGLGIDNAMDGVRLKYIPVKGIYLKTFIGKNRTYFTYSDGIIRGADAEVNLNESLNFESKTKIIVGQGFVSRFQADNNPKFKLPQNIAAYSSRLNIINGGWNYSGEYAIKLNDPIGSLTAEGNNYANGNALMSSLAYSQRGFGIIAEMHRVDHMEFRSERAQEKQYIINYIPTLTKQHTYTLLALYPCATQSEGEFGTQVDVFYKIKKGSVLGGKYGTKISFNFSNIRSLEKGVKYDTNKNEIEEISSSFKNDYTDFTPKFFSKNGELFFNDINLEIYKKINKKMKATGILARQSYNKDVLEGKTPGTYGTVNSTIAIADVSYKIKEGHTVRVELQELLADGGDGSWSMGLVEYTISPHWFFAVQDMYNWGNHDVEKQLHYVNINCGFLKGANRIAIGYGKKRAGIFCVGGVCKEVPSANGFSLTISSSF
ncbi:MAG: hypothetical protein HN522_05955 [Flavobacteriales bacterium]|jgi:hypothetical protein|nr:hypothetical protein [Flavobacteriales bacterium]MBT5090559.1 hypothetical protein [Flavobacteriales bacterium]MBT5750582.1 hypothetical protein [Flavobacteriales bacterium]